MPSRQERLRTGPKARSQRSGTATAELALCLPLLIMLVFACIEACSMIFVKQSLAIASYEGARTSLSPGATTDDVKATSESILDDRRIKDAIIAVEPKNIENAAPGTYLKVTIEVPCDSNSLFSGFFFKHSRLSGQTTMMKEF